MQGLLDHLPPDHLIPPFCRNPRLAPVRASNLPADGPGRVGVVAEVRRATGCMEIILPSALASAIQEGLPTAMSLIGTEL
jgi:hypothetical protein